MSPKVSALGFTINKCSLHSPLSHIPEHACKMEEMFLNLTYLALLSGRFISSNFSVSVHLPITLTYVTWNGLKSVVARLSCVSNYYGHIKWFVNNFPS